MRKIIFGLDEYYHVYNRGVDKREIVLDSKDSNRFLRALEIFNDVDFSGSLAEFDRYSDDQPKGEKLVEIICYCLNPNHFHLLLREIREGGISKFLMKLSGGYSRYFNLRHNRTGTLFQGPFKAKHVDKNSYLNHLSFYINLNDKLHKIGNLVPDLVRSSWGEFCSGDRGLCSKDTILGQFADPQDYADSALDNLPQMLSMRGEYDELKTLTFD